MKYADVIVPLSLEGRFTYSIPPEMEGTIAVGMRAVAEFGPRKKRAVIVARIHNEPPQGEFEIKPLLEVIDSAPVVAPSQIEFWHWLAHYYLCAEGDVMSAALPAGLKLASESILSASDAFDPATPLTPLETAVCDFLTAEGKMSISSLETKTRHKNIMATIRSLLDKQAVRLNEELNSKYKTRRETRVELSAKYFSAAKLDEAIKSASKSDAQSRLLETYLRMSCAAAAIRLRNRNILKPVAKAALLREAACSLSPLASLQKAGVLEVSEVDITRLKSHNTQCLPPQSLSPAQGKAYSDIHAAFAKKDVCLLHGITSSGKTEIYIHLIAHALKAGRTVLYLLPEIALTTQITNRLRLFFGDDMGVYHSKFPDSERVEIWKKQLSSHPYRLIVGARSAVFLPMPNLGLVIVDEEHEPSYKQEDPAPRYNARDAAIVLAAKQGAKTLLGTATPSIETYSNALSGKYSLVSLSERFGDVMLPEIKVEDIKELRRKKMMTGSLSPALIEEIRAALASRQQAILFLNRRGYASFLECRDCGWIPRCDRCDVSLTFHKKSNTLECHYCGAVYRVPEVCPKCGSRHFSDHGVGTEQIEEEVKRLFPDAQTARLDLDTTRGRNAYEEILNGFRNGAADILIGTQMVSKGLDFDRVKVVGILNADTAMSIPDFRSSERAFQMMEQVAGRAGRRSSRGVVVLQTSHPEAEVIGQVVRNDFAGMFRQQMDERTAFVFPPVCRLIYVYVRSRYTGSADSAARVLAQKLEAAFGDNMLGPASPPVPRVKLEYIRQIMLKVPLNAPVAGVREFLRATAAEVRREFRVNIYFDVDPL